MIKPPPGTHFRYVTSWDAMKGTLSSQSKGLVQRQNTPQEWGFCSMWAITWFQIIVLSEHHGAKEITKKKIKSSYLLHERNYFHHSA